MPIILGRRYKVYVPLEKNPEWKQRRRKLMQKYGKPALNGVQTARKSRSREAERNEE
ncbi:hypothetical protein LCGC14_2530380 [marine sediment metagenome]|uniref:Uncharacterized protein n=1 Tax=marine sediment metagenome TaxID=412755 RepID=A0A0F9ATQ3_9ZZZZ